MKRFSQNDGATFVSVQYELEFCAFPSQTTESCPLVTLQQTEEMHQSTLEATDTLTADLNMSENITRQLAAGKLA